MSQRPDSETNEKRCTSKPTNFLEGTTIIQNGEEIRYYARSTMNKTDVDLPSEKGVYALILFIKEFLKIPIGSLGVISFTPGYYIYIGSAKNFGGLKSRITRHFNKSKKKKFWHIDYLTTSQHVEIIGVVYSTITNNTEIDYESILANHVLNDKCFTVACPRFGASDKKHDVSHLYKCICHINKCINSIASLFYSIGLNPKTIFRF